MEDSTEAYSPLLLYGEEGPVIGWMLIVDGPQATMQSWRQLEGKLAQAMQGHRVAYPRTAALFGVIQRERLVRFYRENPDEPNALRTAYHPTLSTGPRNLYIDIDVSLIELWFREARSSLRVGSSDTSSSPAPTPRSSLPITVQEIRVISSIVHIVAPPARLQRKQAASVTASTMARVPPLIKAGTVDAGPDSELGMRAPLRRKRRDPGAQSAVGRAAR
ncbi:uncharacterized protein BP01DRAFT_395551 [Aspergillus saccharolyticus JOP 1030-1]|uniref:Uncharacterized protein n=1 Tax=Aspergillus saccharolyticus JOP 1030-1 TaxID=1450539 RepID=A0A318ZKU2_9EURO|nr:hypothetical protein BP01DRAFT_395551 [Aspergillus saccharolyticus JOP 1030-1]PYH40858.1 hypothetical protein BP01DRAFT_395551 [Aspergillus saccharolyticus JOP 1030-1]